ncbi:MAG: hypothetical protein EOO73_26595 [Myxococcales bacterium]|nr:MAG: hypothetical protein EOO73_26595 [Myxococcales bacterium]
MEPRVKGNAFRTIDHCFTELWGAEARAHALRLLSEPLRRGFEERQLLASNWYPIAWYRETFAAFREAQHAGLELPRELGRRGVKRDMSSVYKQVLLKMVSPQALLGLSQRLFNNYYDTGVMKIEQSRDGYVHAKWTGCEGWDENLWAELSGSCEVLLEMAGAKHVRLHVLKGGRSGDSACEMEARWA